jgi:hypothetical protein
MTDVAKNTILPIVKMVLKHNVLWNEDKVLLSFVESECCYYYRNVSEILAFAVLRADVCPVQDSYVSFFFFFFFFVMASLLSIFCIQPSIHLMRTHIKFELSDSTGFQKKYVKEP